MTATLPSIPGVFQRLGKSASAQPAARGMVSNAFNFLAHPYKGGVNPFSTPLTTDQSADRGMDLAKRLTLGGISLGGGLSLATALVNHIKSLHEENALDSDKSLNRDTLYIAPPGQAGMKLRHKSAQVSPWLSPGMGMTGASLGAVGSYALVQSLYNQFQQARRKKMLQQAQQDAMAMSDLEGEKAAHAEAPKLNLSDAMLGSVTAVPAMTAATAAALAYMGLGKYFPTIKPPERKGPRRIRLVTPDNQFVPIGKDLPAEDPDAIKAAGATLSEQDARESGFAWLVVLTDQISKQASITSDFVHYAATHGTDEMSDMLLDCGVGALLDMTKGAALNELNARQLWIGARALTKAAALHDTVVATAAAEYLDCLPVTTRAVWQSYTPEGICKRAKIGVLLGLQYQEELFPTEQEKSAHWRYPTQQDLLQHRSGGAKNQGAVAEKRDAALTSDYSGGMEDGAEGSGEKSTTDANESQAQEDPIDHVMQGRHSALKPT